MQLREISVTLIGCDLVDFRESIVNGHRRCREKVSLGRRTNCQRPPRHVHEGIDHLGFANGYAILGQNAERSHYSNSPGTREPNSHPPKNP
jgi:hypothetical protein